MDSGNVQDEPKFTSFPESTEHPGTSTPPHSHTPLKKVISINGEPIETAKFDDIDIHDYTTFEHEQLIGKLINSTRRKTPSEELESKALAEQLKGLSKKASFKDVVRNVIRAEHVIKSVV